MEEFKKVYQFTKSLKTASMTRFSVLEHQALFLALQ